MTKTFATFHLGDYYFGIPVERVQEVIKYQEVTSIPVAPDTISGLMNLRGEIVTVIDLAVRLEVKRRKPIEDIEKMNVVIKDDDSLVSLLVDKIGDIQEVDDLQYEQAPENIKGKAKELILGTYKMNKDLLLILDIEKVIEIRPDI